MFLSSRTRAGLVTVWAYFFSVVVGHSWVEQLMVIGSNGSFTGNPGYVRGQVVRDQNFQDSEMVNLIPPNGRATGNEILTTDPMCRPSQSIGNYSSDFPILSASPGDMVALRYQENGHVTQPQLPPGKPPRSGAVYIYGTASPRNSDTFLAIHNVWNEDGTGGDGRGRLLATRYFDDGQCYQVNTAPISIQRQAEFSKPADALMGVNLWCQTDMRMPSAEAAAGGTYALYWVWDWPTAASESVAAKNETYTTCMDVDLSNNSSSASQPTGNDNANANANAEASVQFAADQDLNNAAISTQMTNNYDVTSTASASASGLASSTISTTPTPTSPAGAAGAVTVTVTASALVSYITVTETVASASAPASATASPLPSSSSSSPSSIPVYPSSSDSSSLSSATELSSSSSSSSSSTALATSSDANSASASIASFSTLRVPPETTSASVFPAPSVVSAVRVSTVVVAGGATSLETYTTAIYPSTLAAEPSTTTRTRSRTRTTTTALSEPASVTESSSSSSPGAVSPTVTTMTTTTVSFSNGTAVTGVPRIRGRAPLLK